MFWGRTVAAIFCLLFSDSAWAAIPFTGLATQDFPSQACLADPGGIDVGMPSAFPSNQISGFDMPSFCFSFDPSNDTLYIAVPTYNDSSNRPNIFGDADGDGDPSQASATLISKGGQDPADLGGREFFTLAIDFNLDSAPDLVVGVNTATDLSQFQAVGGVAAPDNDLLLAARPQFYGAALAGVTASLFGLPSNAAPHLEFSISGLSQVPGFGTLNFNDPDSYFQLYVTTGSLADDGISEEFFPNIATYQSMTVETLRDIDGDTIPDAFDLDDDNDTLPDLLEKDLSQYDTNGDGVLSAAEVAASGKDTDGDGDIDIHDVGAWPDTDTDATPDFLDADSDGDGISDANEAGSPPARDSDRDGIPDFREIDSDGDGLNDNVEDVNRNGRRDGNETDLTKADTDGDGISDRIEIQQGRNPLVAERIVGGSGGPVDPSPTPTSVRPTASPPPSETRLGGDVDLGQGPVRLQGGPSCSVVSSPSFGMGFYWLFLIFWLGFVPRVWGLNADHYRENSDGLGFFALESAKTLPKKEFSFGLMQYISDSPLGLGSTLNGRQLDNVVGYFYVWDFWGAYSLVENLELGINFPVSLATQVEDLNSSVERNTSSLGDLRLQTKWHFLENFSLLTFLNLPSGDSADFFGEGNVSGGLKGIASRAFGFHEWALNLGVLARARKTITASNINLLEVGPEMLWDAGWRWPMSLSHQWYLMTHFWGGSDFAGEATSPVEWDFGFQKRFDKQPIEATLGLGFGMNRGYGNPDYRLVFGLNYISKRPGEKDQGPKNMTQAKWEGKEIVILQPIHFEVNKSIIRPESFSILDDVAKLLERNRTILKVAIEGHTDSDGSDAFNLRLSEIRAKAVRNYLIRQGVEVSRLESKGWGESHPLVAGDTPEHKLQNRRVEFHVVEVER